MHGSGRYFFALISLSATLCAGHVSYAQDKKTVSVVDRAKYKFLPQGFRSGSFIFSPGIGVDGIYEDNVFGDEANTKSDFITTVKPSFTVASDFNLHALYFNTNATLGYYKKYDDENYTDYAFTGGGRLDLDYDTSLSLASAYRKSHEERNSPDDPNADEPLQFSVTSYKAQFTRALGIIKLYVDAAYDAFRYDDVRRGGISINTSQRDRDIYTVGTKIAYEYFPGYNVYAASRTDWRAYNEKSPISRDSTGQEFQFGTDFEITAKVKGDAYIGHLTRDYDQGASDISAMSYGGSLIWDMTGLTSLTVNVTRGVNETFFNDATGDLKTDYNLQIDHVLRHNLFLSAGAGLSQSDYEQVLQPDREDTVYQGRVGIEYVPYDGTSIALKYQYSQRESNKQGEDRTNNRLILSLGKQF